jgi:hypothetical protein
LVLSVFANAPEHQASGRSNRRPYPRKRVDK